MPYPPSAYDAHLWIRHDAARWSPPGTDLANLSLELKRQREAAEDAAFAAQIAASRRFLAALRVEVDELKAELKRRRLEEAKYSPSQPRVPGGNPRGGQWTDRSAGNGQSQGTGLAQRASMACNSRASRSICLSNSSAADMRSANMPA